MVWFKTRRDKAARQKLALHLQETVNRFRDAVVRTWELQEATQNSPADERQRWAEMISSEQGQALEAWNAILADSHRLSEEMQMRLRALAELAAINTTHANINRRKAAITRFTEKVLEQLDSEA